MTTSQQLRMIVITVIVLVTLAGLLVAYYWVHKPLTVERVQMLGGGLLDLLTAGTIVAIAGGLGRRALARADLSPASRAEQVALQALLGLGFIAWGALLLGLIGLFNGIALCLALLAAGLLVRLDVKRWLADMRDLALHAARPTTPWTALLTGITGFLLFTALLHTLLPPYAWDVLLYHLVGPQQYLAAGRIAAQSDNHLLGFPQGAELVYGVAISLFGRDTAAAPVHFAFGILALLSIGGLARRYADEAVAWLAVVLLVGGFSLWALFGEAYVDLAVMAYGAAAFVSLVCWNETRSQAWLILAGLSAGLALGVKYTAASLILALAVFVSWRAPRQAARNLAILVGVAGLAFLPWMIKGALLYRNPIYPYFFGGVNWDAERSSNYNASGGGLLGSGKDWQLAVLPFAATVFGVEQGAGYGFTVGPWLLTAWILLLPGWPWLDERARRLARDSLILGAALLAFWLVAAALTGMGGLTRLMAVAMPVAAVSGALGFYSLGCLPRKPVDLSFIVRALLIMTLFFGVLEVASATLHTGAAQYLLAFTNRENFLTDRLGAYINAMRHLNTLPAGSRIRMMWEPRSYYCPPIVTCIPDILFDYWSRPRKSGHTPDQIFRDWQSSGDDYLLLFDRGYEFYAREDKNFAAADFPQELERRMIPVWTDGISYTLYAWRTQ